MGAGGEAIGPGHGGRADAGGRGMSGLAAVGRHHHAANHAADVVDVGESERPANAAGAKNQGAADRIPGSTRLCVAVPAPVKLP